MTVADAKLTKPEGKLAEKRNCTPYAGCAHGLRLRLRLGSAAGHRLSSRLNRSRLLIVYQTKGAVL